MHSMTLVEHLSRFVIDAVDEGEAFECFLLKRAEKHLDELETSSQGSEAATSFAVMLVARFRDEPASHESPNLEAEIAGALALFLESSLRNSTGKEVRVSVEVDLARQNCNVEMRLPT